MNDEGNRHVLFQKIVEHRYDLTEVKEHDALFTTCTKKKIHRVTKKGVEFLVQCKDGSTTWVNLNDMKKSHPMQMAEYMVQRQIAGKP